MAVIQVVVRGLNNIKMNLDRTDLSATIERLRQNNLKKKGNKKMMLH